MTASPMVQHPTTDPASVLAMRENMGQPSVSTDIPLLPGGLPAWGPMTDMPVTVTNHGDVDLIWKYDNRRLKIPAHSSRMVPYMFMVRYMGDPRAVDIDRKHRPRFDETQRLSRLYGIYEHGDLWKTSTAPCKCRAIDEAGAKIDTSKCSGHLPYVSAHSIETGEQIITVIDDPEGRHLKPAPSAESSDLEQLREIVAIQATQLQNLTNQLTARENEHKSLTDELGIANEDVGLPVEDAAKPPSKPPRAKATKVTADTQ